MNATQPTYEQLLARVAELESNKRKGNALSLKVGAKGGVSLYNTGRFPVTLYPETWVKVLDMAETIREFISTNRDAGLAFKNGIPSMGIPAGYGKQAE